MQYPTPERAIITSVIALSFGKKIVILFILHLIINN